MAARRRRAGRGRGLLRARSPRPASTTAPPSRACAPPGAGARSSSPRSSSTRSSARRPGASRSTRRCSTPPCTRRRCRARPGEELRGCPSPGAASASRAGGARARCGCGSTPPASGLALRLSDADRSARWRPSERSPRGRSIRAQLRSADAGDGRLTLRSELAAADELPGSPRTSGEARRFECVPASGSRSRPRPPQAALRAGARRAACSRDRRRIARAGSPSSPAVRSPSTRGRVPDPAAAAVWGLVRSRPGRAPGPLPPRSTATAARRPRRRSPPSSRSPRSRSSPCARARPWSRAWCRAPSAGG